MLSERHYLLEARQILEATDGEAWYLPEKMHLVALDEAHQCELIRIANEIEMLKKKVLNGH